MCVDPSNSKPGRDTHESLETHSPPERRQEDPDSLNRLATGSDTESVITPMKTPCKPEARTGCLHGRLLPNWQRGTYMALFTLSQETEEDETLPESFYEPLSPRYLNHTETTKKEKLQNRALYEHRCKMWNKILANQIQQHTKRITHHDQLGFIPGSQG